MSVGRAAGWTRGPAPRLGLVLLLALVSVAAGSLLSRRFQPEPLPAATPAALVDGHAITRASFRWYGGLFRALYNGPRARPGTVAARTIEQRIADRAIDQAISEYITVRAAERAGLVAPPPEVDKTARRFLAAGPLHLTAAEARHAARIAVLADMITRQRRDRHWLDHEAQVSTITYFVGSRAGLSPAAMPAGEPGHQAPAFVATDIRGRVVALGDLLGSPVVLTLWQARCLGCGGDLRVLQRFARRHQGIRVVAVDEGDSAAVVAALGRSLGPGPRLWVDRPGIARDLYNPTGLPATYILDRRGIIREMNQGALVDDSTLEGRASPILQPGTP